MNNQFNLKTYFNQRTDMWKWVCCNSKNRKQQQQNAWTLNKLKGFINNCSQFSRVYFVGHKQNKFMWSANRKRSKCQKKSICKNSRSNQTFNGPKQEKNLIRKYIELRIKLKSAILNYLLISNTCNDISLANGKLNTEKKHWKLNWLIYVADKANICCLCLGIKGCSLN